MVAALIPALNDKTMEHVLEAAAAAGAREAAYVIMRLPNELKTLFKEWLAEHYPQRAEHVMSIVRQMRGGRENDPNFGTRMTGTGNYAELMREALRHRLPALRPEPARGPPTSTAAASARPSPGGQLKLVLMRLALRRRRLGAGPRRSSGCRSRPRRRRSTSRTATSSAIRCLRPADVLVLPALSATQTRVAYAVGVHRHGHRPGVRCRARSATAPTRCSTCTPTRSACCSAGRPRSLLPSQETRLKTQSPAVARRSCRRCCASSAPGVLLVAVPVDGLGRRHLLRRPARHRAARRPGAGVPADHAAADDLRRRHGRRRVLGDRARARRGRRARRARSWWCTRWSSPRRWASRFTVAGPRVRPVALPPARRRAARPSTTRSRYSNIVFAGAVAVWIANTLSSVLRGTGNMLAPALTLIGAALRPPAAVGDAGRPRIGIAGAGIAYVTTFGIAALAMAVVVLALEPAAAAARGLAARVAPVPRDPARRRDLVAPALQTVLTAVILTGFVGRYGAAALAGYGVGLRLELLQIPLVFAVGQALVVLVGTHIGAGPGERAQAHRLDRRGARGVDQPRDRRHGGAVSARLGGPLQHRPRGARERRALPAHRGAVLSAARRRHRALLRLAGRRARAAGRCSPAPRASRW